MNAAEHGASDTWRDARPSYTQSKPGNHKKLCMAQRSMAGR